MVTRRSTPAAPSKNPSYSQGEASANKNPSPFQGEGRVRVSARARRRGFTLVELMMSLIIIGLLTTLVGVAVNFALIAAKNVAIKADIANLDQALQQYKNSYGSEYPACMAIPPMAKVTPSRYDLFDRSLKKRFNRYTGGYAVVQSLLYQGNTSVTPNIPAWTVNVIGRPGTQVSLNIDNLDAAEAIVFWLAGPPTPITQTSSTILWGFCANPTNPFAQAGSRAPSLYEFDETRLTDVDGDGWPEYVPKMTSTLSSGVPPYVYFEPNSYRYTYNNFIDYHATYPGFFGKPLKGGAPNALLPSWQNTLNGMLPSATAYTGTVPRMSGDWGFAVPYLTMAQLDSSTNQMLDSLWAPKKFQLISAGLDGEYGGSQIDENGQGRKYCPVVPQTAAQGAPQYIMQGDNDNLTNFIDTKIEDYTP